MKPENLSYQNGQKIEYTDIKRGDKAPFDGKVLSHAAIARLLSEFDAKVKELNIKIQYLEKVNSESNSLDVKVCGIQVSTEKEKIKICEDARVSEKAIYMSAIDRINKQCERKWYESPYLNFAAGAVVFGAISAGVSYVVK